jgi:hypothetical protein
MNPVRMLRPRRAAAALLAAVLLLGARPATSGEAAPAPGASSFQVTAPVTGYQIVAGSTVLITWTSAAPSGNVNISLVDVNAWAVADVVAWNTPDDGQEAYTLPANLPAGEYLIYIENVGVTDWTYGTSFDVLACGGQVQQRSTPRMHRDPARPLPAMPRPDGGERPQRRP